ncbi:hypothetical protein FA15DRAFT_663965 [Coprinopsis marcescibilis]|uniref:RING-type domain-containing protein n=1 Tax=Coprinopsis marcescibilis TaxID=230819 RepID=A0A5C3L9D4_COPMA|nr:hypothetical protein FA15DRAFT_663965 [Coprinopsis marcescibilis]
MSTRQATPGPSNSTSLKRAASSDTEEPSSVARDAKKPKKDKTSGSSPLVTMNGSTSAPRDKEKGQKKRRRKRKKQSVSQDTPLRQRTKPKSRSSVPEQTASSHSATTGVQPDATTTLGTSLPPAPGPGPEPDSNDSGSETDPGDDEPSKKKDKGKGKERPRSRSHTTTALPACEPGLGRAEEALTSLIIASTSMAPSTSAQAEAQAAEIERLTQRLAEHTALLQQHQTQLASVQQSLTCQICLDLLHRPFALSPCGHIACYTCLLRWFTANPARELDGPALNPEDIVNGNINPQAVAGRAGRQRMPFAHRAALREYLTRRKNCPLCRADVRERPVEVYSVKDMVATLVRSQLVDLPVPPDADAPAPNVNGNPDPWNNIFHPIGQRRPLFEDMMFGPPPPLPRREPANGEANDQEQMGWYDAEDGGVYRCLDCMHEIFGRHCSSCDREYPGHPEADDDSEGDEEAADFFPMDGYFRALADVLLNNNPGDVDDDSEDDFYAEDDIDDAFASAHGDDLDDIEMEGFRDHGDIFSDEEVHDELILVGRGRRNGAAGRAGGAARIREVHSSEEESEEDELRYRIEIVGDDTDGPWARREEVTLEGEGDSDGDYTSDDAYINRGAIPIPGAVGRHVGRRYRYRAVPSPPPRRINQPTIVISDDEEEDDDPPPRRQIRFRSARARVLPEPVDVIDLVEDTEDSEHQPSEDSEEDDDDDGSTGTGHTDEGESEEDEDEVAHIGRRRILSLDSALRPTEGRHQRRLRAARNTDRSREGE